MKNIDLHIHSNYSDGVLSPKEIIDEAFKNNVDTISITDHDTILSYTKELFDYAKEKGIKLIPGIEISTKEKVGIHILGYNIDINNKKLLDTLYNLKNSRHIYLKDVSDLLTKLGYKVNFKELDNIKSVTKAHIAEDIINNKENKDILLKTFNHIPNKGEFIETIMNEGCKAYVKKITISPIEAVDIIHEAGGKAVLAHPVGYKYEDNLDINDIQELVSKINPDGIEAYYHYVDRNNNRIDEVLKWNTFAKNNNKFITIGSDFHNKDGIRPEIGFINWKINITEKEKKEIINNILN